ncbi:hypothetical protein OHA71_47310 [Streptomyces sp. NBC_00444]
MPLRKQGVEVDVFEREEAWDERAAVAARDESAAVVEGVVEEHSGSRVPAGHVPAELSLRNLEELSAHVADSSFLERRAPERRLHEPYPELYKPLCRRAAFTGMPYDAAQRTCRELNSARDPTASASEESVPEPRFRAADCCGARDAAVAAERRQDRSICG